MKILSLEGRLSAIEEKAEELLNAEKRSQLMRDQLAKNIEAARERVRQLKSAGIM